MAKYPRIRLGFQVEGLLRQFVTFRDNASGTTSILFPFMPSETLPSEVGKENPKFLNARIIKECKYSVHPSPQYPDENVIHWTQISEEGHEFDSPRIFTKAIKSMYGFAFIYDYLCFSLKLMPAIKGKKTDVVFDLGSYDPGTQTLFYSLFVGHKNRTFMASGNGIFQHATRNYRFVLLYSFAKLPSAPFGTWSHLPTSKLSESATQKEKDLHFYQIRGLLEGDCFTMHKIRRDQALNAFAEKIREISEKNP